MDSQVVWEYSFDIGVNRNVNYIMISCLVWNSGVLMIDTLMELPLGNTYPFKESL